MGARAANHSSADIHQVLAIPLSFWSQGTLTVRHSNAGGQRGLAEAESAAEMADIEGEGGGLRVIHWKCSILDMSWLPVVPSLLLV